MQLVWRQSLEQLAADQVAVRVQRLRRHGNLDDGGDANRSELGDREA